MVDGSRIEQDVVDFAALNQSVIQLTEVVMDSVTSCQGAKSGRCRTGRLRNGRGGVALHIQADGSMANGVLVGRDHRRIFRSGLRFSVLAARNDAVSR